MKRRDLLARFLAGSALGLGLSVPAWAQEGASTAESDASAIIVTARRVEERLQDVPISITVFNQEQLTNQNISSGRDLATITPSLNVNTRFGSDNASFSIRGFTQEARTTSSVGVYFADVVLPRASTISASGEGAGPGFLFDLENVQVLKGPQGTLFGRNTTGGAVVLSPKRPTDQVEGYVEGSFGNHNMRRLQAVVNLPASDTLRFRAGIDWQKRDGYLKNVSGVGPKDFANIDYLAARFSVLWDVTDDIENYTVASYSESKPNGALPKITDCLNTPAAVRNCEQIERERGLGDYVIANSLPWAHQHMKVWQVVNTTEWQASDNLTVKNIASYGQSILDQATDVTGVWNPLTPMTTNAQGVPVAVPDAWVGMGYGSSTTQSPFDGHSAAQWTFTEEVQLQGSSFEGALDWQAGVYFERNGPVGFSGTQSIGGALCNNIEQWETFTCTDPAAALGSDTQLGPGTNHQIGKVNFRNIGLYAQGTYKFTDQFSIDAGLRYTWDKTWGFGESIGVRYSGDTGWNTPTFGCLNDKVYEGSFSDCRTHLSQKTSAPTWMVGLNYKPIDDILIYAKYSRGYRQGSVSPLAAVGFQKYGAEKVDVYEGGIKSSFNGPIRGTFNISGFYNDFRDMQMQLTFMDLVPNTDIPNMSPNPSITNIGKARIWGFEVESTLQPFEGLSLQASYSYINTELLSSTFDGFPNAPDQGYDTLSTIPEPGTRLPFTPKYKLTVGANYTLPLDRELGKISVGGTFIRTGSIYYGEDAGQNAGLYEDSIFAPGSPNIPYATSPAYNLVNFNVNWENIGQSAVSLSAFMTNAFGKVYFGARSPSSRGFTQRYYGEPRMYGLRLRYDW